MRSASTTESSSSLRPPTGGLAVFEIAAVNADKPSLSREVLLDRIAQFHPTHPIGQALLASGITNCAVCVTSKPFFVDKSELFPDCRFVIGADTAVRLIDSKYYVDKTAASNVASETISTTSIVGSQQSAVLNMVAALSKIVYNGCSFIVGGRIKQVAPSPVVSGASSNSPVSSLSSSMDTFETWTDLEQSSPTAQNLPQPIKRMFRSLSEAQFRSDLSSTKIRNQAAATASAQSKLK
jgi:hypothetical protein